MIKGQGRMVKKWVQKVKCQSQMALKFLVFEQLREKINRFQKILVFDILKKFDIGIKQICPPHLETVHAIPWEVQNTDSSFLFNNDFN